MLEGRRRSGWHLSGAIGFMDYRKSGFSRNRNGSYPRPDRGAEGLDSRRRSPGGGLAGDHLDQLPDPLAVLLR